MHPEPHQYGPLPQSALSDHDGLLSARTSTLLSLALLYDQPTSGWTKLSSVISSLGLDSRLFNLVGHLREQRLVTCPPTFFDELRLTKQGRLALARGLEHSTLSIRELSDLVPSYALAEPFTARDAGPMFATQNRLRIAAAMTRRDGPRTPAQLARALGMLPKKVIEDLNVLERAGCVEITEHSDQPQMHRYEMTSRAQRTALNFANTWLELIDSAAAKAQIRLPTSLLRPGWRDEEQQQSRAMAFGALRTMYYLAASSGTSDIPTMADKMQNSRPIIRQRLMTLRESGYVKQSKNGQAADSWSLTSSGAEELSSRLPTVDACFAQIVRRPSSVSPEHVKATIESMAVGGALITALLASARNPTPRWLANKTRLMSAARREGTIGSIRRKSWFASKNNLGLKPLIKASTNAFVIDERPTIRAALMSLPGLKRELAREASQRCTDEVDAEHVPGVVAPESGRPSIDGSVEVKSPAPRRTIGRRRRGTTERATGQPHVPIPHDAPQHAPEHAPAHSAEESSPRSPEVTPARSRTRRQRIPSLRTDDGATIDSHAARGPQSPFFMTRPASGEPEADATSPEIHNVDVGTERANPGDETPLAIEGNDFPLSR